MQPLIQHCRDQLITNQMTKVVANLSLLLLIAGCTTTRPTVQEIQINECSSQVSLRNGTASSPRWNRSTTTTVREPKSIFQSMYLSEISLKIPTRMGKSTTKKLAFDWFLQFANEQDKQFQQKNPNSALELEEVMNGVSKTVGKRQVFWIIGC